MKASYDYIVRYDAEATCVTPLRTADASGDVECVLRYADGTPIVQGSSLAGAMRGWLAASSETEAASLFGNRQTEGRLSVSDGRFTPESVQLMRPHLRIDRVSGSVDGDQKFDTAHIAAGSKFSFTLIWRGMAAGKGEAKTVERILIAMNAGEIRLGAQKTNGFGHVELSVKKLELSMYDAAQRKKWLDQEQAVEELVLSGETCSSGVQFRVFGETDSILVKASSPETWESDGKKSYYTPNLTESGTAILPGSSVKGAIRSRCEMIAKYAKLNKVFTDALFGREAEENDNGLAGHVVFEDVRLSNIKRQLTRIHVNRFTGGVMRSGPFTEEPICSDLEIPITAPDDAAGCALLLFALRDLGLGLYTLGSGSAIGRGRIQIERIEIQKPGKKTAEMTFGGDGPELTDADGVCAEWLRAWEERIGK